MTPNVEIAGPAPRAPARRAGRKIQSVSWRTIVLLVAPFTIVYLVFLIYPTLRVIELSFTNSDIAGVGHFIGGRNYQLLMKDPLFWASLWHTIYFIILTVVPNTLVGLVFGLMVVRLKRLRNTALALFFLPYILPVSVVTQIWLWVLDPNFGIINFLTRLKINWFSEAAWAMPAVAFVTIWWTVGFNMLLFIAGLEAIPREYYEAAALDGAGGGFRSFIYITWPLLWPVTSLVLLLQLIAQWQIFNQVYLLTAGGPYNSTIVVLQYMYVRAFQQQQGGYASAISVVLFVIILITSLVYLRFVRLRGNT